MTAEEIITKLKLCKNPKNIAGMARFGIQGKNILGVNVPILRNMARDVKKSDSNLHSLAQELWDSGIHEARILASMVDDPEKVTSAQMDNWATDFDSWDVCDQVCMNLFCRTSFAYRKVFEWAQRKEEFVKRAGFALIACLAVHDKKAKDKDFVAFFPLIKEYSNDERNFVRKAVNWALRQIGKRNLSLNKKAIVATKEIQALDNKTAKWISNDALRELSSEAVQKKLK